MGVVSEKEKLSRSVVYLAMAVVLSYGSTSFAHDAPGHLDPDLLSGWITWLHLTIQWVHLTTFALWLGLTAGALTFRLNPPLDWLLYSSWVLLLILLATGTYNTEWSAGIAETPSLFMLPLLAEIPYGVTYTLALASKVGLYGLAVLLTLVTTVLHVTRRIDEARVRKAFLLCGSLTGILLTLGAAMVLFYHEAADLWPTKIHSLGGVLGPEGARGQIDVGLNSSPPNDFGLLWTRDAWIDIGLRWIHLLGFGLWTGSSAWILLFRGASPRRFLVVSWLLLAVLALSGMASMGRWTPFSSQPYLWNLHELSLLRFGRCYTLFMGLKHLLVLAGVAITGIATAHYKLAQRNPVAKPFRTGFYAAAGLILGLAIGYVMMVVLLLHEGVDHAL